MATAAGEPGRAGHRAAAAALGQRRRRPRVERPRDDAVRRTGSSTGTDAAGSARDGRLPSPQLAPGPAPPRSGPPRPPRTPRPRGRTARRPAPRRNVTTPSVRPRLRSTAHSACTASRGHCALPRRPRRRGLLGAGTTAPRSPARDAGPRVHAWSAGCPRAYRTGMPRAPPAEHARARRPGGRRPATRTSRTRTPASLPVPSGRRAGRRAGRSARGRRSPARAKSRWTVAASVGSSHSAAARAGPVQLVGPEPQPGRLLLGRLASVTSWKSQPTPSGTGSSASGEASRRNPLRQHAPPLALAPCRSVTHSSAGAGGAPSASTCVERALQLLDALRRAARPAAARAATCARTPSARAACALTTAGRRSASTSTTPQDASSNSASLSAMDRSRSICACTSLKAQYTPAGFPSAPSTPADWVRTSTRPPSLRQQRELVHLPARGVASRPSAAPRPPRRRRSRTAHPANPCRPTASSAVQPRIRSASRFQWVTTPSASKAQSAASIPSSSAASSSSSPAPRGLRRRRDAERGSSGPSAWRSHSWKHSPATPCRTCPPCCCTSGSFNWNVTQHTRMFARNRCRPGKSLVASRTAS